MKKYLNYYIGCEGIVYFQDEHGEYTIERKCRLSIDYEEDDDVIPVWTPLPSDHIDEFDDCDRKFKPILHLISDMDEETMLGLWKLIFRRDFNKNGVIKWIGKNPNSADPRWVLSSGLERLGIEISGTVWADSDLSPFKHNQHSVTNYLLGDNPQGKFFDLWNLIESGDAIDVKTLS